MLVKKKVEGKWENEEEDGMSLWLWRGFSQNRELIQDASGG